MSKLMQFSGLIGLSAALHVAAFWGAAPEGGAPTGGGGRDAVTLVAAPASLAQAVDQWDRVAEAVEEVTETIAPRPDAAPRLEEAMAAAPVSPPLSQPARPAQQTALPIPAAPAAPRQPEAFVPPAPQPAPKLPQTRPARRPEPPLAPAQPPEPVAAPPARPAADPAPSAPQPAARAAGRGTGAQTGQAAQSGAEAPSAVQVNALKTRWGAGISKRIHRRQRYPSGTRVEGVVHLIVSVTTEGALAGVRIARSAGDARLDAAALRAAQSANLPAAPKGMPAGTHDFLIRLNFTR